MKRFDDEDLRPVTDNEDALVNTVLAELSDCFEVHRQVSGIYPGGKRMRIDSVLVPKDKEIWRNKDVALGVEFKSSYLTESKDLSGALGQLIDYSLVEWEGFGQLPIFVCPGLRPRKSQYRKEFAEGYRYGFSRVMKEFNIGELLPHSYYGWSFVMAGSHDMWTQLNGTCEGKLWGLKRKYGNRGIGVKK